MGTKIYKSSDFYFVFPSLLVIENHQNLFFFQNFDNFSGNRLATREEPIFVSILLEKRRDLTPTWL